LDVPTREREKVTWGAVKAKELKVKGEKREKGWVPYGAA